MAAEQALKKTDDTSADTASMFVYFTLVNQALSALRRTTSSSWFNSVRQFSSSPSIKFSSSVRQLVSY